MAKTKTIIIISVLLIFLSRFAFAADVTMKINPIKDNRGNTNVEFSFYRGSKKIASQIYDIKRKFLLVKEKGDIPDGIVKAYDPLTNVLTEYTYRNNRKDGEAITYYATGEKSSVQNYENGQLSGLQRGFYKNGGLKKEYIINHDKPSRYREYYENGNLKQEVVYLIGKSFFENKTISKKMYDKSGHLISEKTYGSSGE